MKPGILAFIACLSLGGCAFTGLSDAQKDFRCKAPDGVLCTSVSGVYANSLADNLPAQKADKTAVAQATAKADDAPRTFSPQALDAPNSGVPLRIPPLVLRVWIAPWEDSDGDLHDQQYFYTVLNNGRWMIEHNQENIRNKFKPVFPLKKPRSEADNDQSGAAEAVAADAMAQGQPHDNQAGTTK